MQQRKSAKDPRKMVDRIRRFLSGEDIVNEIIPKTWDLSKLSTQQLNALRIAQEQGIEAIEGMVLVQIHKDLDGPSWQDREEGQTAWWENTGVHVVTMMPFEKTYPDPEIEGVSYQNAANVPKIEDIPERTNSSKKTERSETAAMKPVKRIDKPKPSPAEIEEKERQARVLENRLQQEKILKIREDFNWHDVPFSSWINQLNRR